MLKLVIISFNLIRSIEVLSLCNLIGTNIIKILTKIVSMFVEANLWTSGATKLILKIVSKSV